MVCGFCWFGYKVVALRDSKKVKETPVLNEGTYVNDVVRIIQ